MIGTQLTYSRVLDVKDGEVSEDVYKYLRDNIAILENGKYLLTIEQADDPLTVKQFRYFKFLVRLMSDHTGHRPDECEEYLITRFEPTWDYRPGLIKKRRHQLSNIIACTENFLQVDLNCTIPPR